MSQNIWNNYALLEQLKDERFDRMYVAMVYWLLISLLDRVLGVIHKGCPHKGRGVSKADPAGGGLKAYVDTQKLSNWIEFIEKNVLKLMMIYKSLYKSLNSSLQMIRSITINNTNSQKWSLCYDVDFSKKNADVRGEWGLKIRKHADKGEGGVKNGQKFADVLYEWPLRCLIYSLDNPCTASWLNYCRS